MFNFNLMKRLLIIPARIGSKRIIKKNIKLFLKKPIINYSIKTAKLTNLFDKIHISTDSKIIKKIDEKKKIKVDFLRSKDLSGDKVGLLDVFKFVIKKYKQLGFNFDEIWFLTPCSPLIEVKDLIKASIFFKKNRTKAMLAVAENSPPIQWSFEIKTKNQLKPLFKNFLKYRSQDIPKTYYDTGTFGAFKSSVLDKKSLVKYSGFIIPKYKGIDIDTMDDWLLAEKIFKKKI